MQPPPDAIGEFKVVTNNMSAEYGRAAGATINVNYRSGTNTLHGSGWEFLRDTALNATGFFKPATGKPPLDRHQFGGVLGGPIVRNKRVLLRRLRRVPADPAGRPAFATIADAGAAPGHPRRSTCATRAPASIYPAGTPIPMTAFARQVLAALPDTNVAGNANNYTHAAGVHRRLEQGGRQGRPAG